VKEVCAMWKQNTAKTIPLLITSTGVIPKSLPQGQKKKWPTSEYVHTNAKNL
jgi:hypothetical protein